MRKVFIPLTVAVMVAGTAAPASAASTSGSCKLSANWTVTASANWNGSNWSYGVLNSPGPLRSGGSPDGTVSEFFLFRGSDLRYSGAYHNRDATKPDSYVYRTQPLPGSGSAGLNITDATQYAIAPSGIFCPIRLDRP